jgi:hypothetical protein
LERVGDEERRVGHAVAFKIKARIGGNSARGLVGVEGVGGFAIGGEGKEIEEGEDGIFSREMQRRRKLLSLRCSWFSAELYAVALGGWGDKCVAESVSGTGDENSALCNKGRQRGRAGHVSKCILGYCILYGDR